jgi:hypothetical protein
MDHIAHAWIAVRAVQYLRTVDAKNPFINLLSENIKDAFIAAWLPDLNDSKLGSGDTDNHVFKIVKIDSDQRFVMDKAALAQKLGKKRAIISYLERDSTLSDDWWQGSYKASPKPGQHIPNKVNSMIISLTDMAILGSPEIQDMLEKKRETVLSKKVCTNAAQLATYFYMLSHFISDTCMPCHCDGRPFNSYKKGYHNKMEEAWSKTIDESYLLGLFSKKGSDQIIDGSTSIDGKFGIELPQVIGNGKKLINTYDMWEEMVLNCRAFFALNHIMVPNRDADPIQKYAYTDLSDESKNLMGHICIQDAIYNVALVWKFIGHKFLAED